MRLAVISPFPPAITGISQYGYHITRSLAHSGRFSNITVLAGSAYPGGLEGLPRSVHVEHAWQPDRIESPLAILASLHRLRPDLVWFNLGSSVFGRSPLVNLASFSALRLVRRLQIPVLVTLHELLELADLRGLRTPGHGLVRMGARLFTHIATPADVVCFTMSRYADWFAARRSGPLSVHIPIGAYRQPERLPESGDPELLFFTSLAPFKGLELLLDAFPRVRARSPQVHLTIAGSEHPRFPGYAARLRQICADMPGVRWLGQVPEGHVRELFRRAQLVVLPYTAATGSSSVLYQAAAWGRAVVASELPEIVSLTEENGLEVEFFRRGDPTGLARSIQVLLASPEHRRAQVAHNFKAMERLGPEEICHQYLHAFNLALETRHSPQRLDVPLISMEPG